MPCFHPIKAWQRESGEIVFSESGRIARSLNLPCSQCVGCRLERSRQWAVRCMHEASLYSLNCFITLTYDDEHVPENGSLDYRHFQLFLKRLRKNVGKVRFYMCGEYGDLNNRPHFHACLFGVDFDDKVLFRKLESGSCLYTSEKLSKLWPYGYSTIGDVTFDSAAYVARYVMKKVTGSGASAHYTVLNPETGELTELTPEFCRMSLKPGIGAGWFKKWKTDVYPHDYVIVNGVKAKPPRFYDKLLEREDPFAAEALQADRYKKAEPFLEDGSPERLAVREKVTKARVALKKRAL